MSCLILPPEDKLPPVYGANFNLIKLSTIKMYHYPYLLSFDYMIMTYSYKLRCKSILPISIYLLYFQTQHVICYFGIVTHSDMLMCRYTYTTDYVSSNVHFFLQHCLKHQEPFPLSFSQLLQQQAVQIEKFLV